LGLIDSLQRLSLQTQYEVAIGADAAALGGLRQKVELSELMPAAQCGAMHALLAIASQRRGQHEVAQWLRRRAELLCTAEQLAGMGATWMA